MKKYQATIGKSESVNVAPTTIPNFMSVTATLDMEIAVYPYDASAASERLDNLLMDAISGKPLRRSKEVNALATKACTLHGRKPTSAKLWASKLAESLTNPND
jgi:hypothetical protein